MNVLNKKKKLGGYSLLKGLAGLFVAAGIVACATPAAAQSQTVVINSQMYYLDKEPNKPITVPGLDFDKPFNANVDAFIGEGDCNKGGLGDTLVHPFNAKCDLRDYTQSTRANGTYGIVNNQDGTQDRVLVVGTNIDMSVARGIHGAIGSGYVIPLSSFLGAASGVTNAVVAVKELGIQNQLLAIQKASGASLVGALDNAKITSLAGTVICGSANGGGTSGNVTGLCMLNSPTGNSSVGVGNTTTPTGTNLTINPSQLIM